MKPGDPEKNAPWKTWDIPGVSVLSSMMQASESVRLRVIDFRPPRPGKNPPVVFVAGWITRMETWKDVLEEMTRDFRVIYIETRDKISSEVRGKVSFGVEATGKDVVHLISGFGIGDGYVLFGSSLRS